MSRTLEEINAKVALGDTVPREEFVAAVDAEVKARAAVTYFIYKELREQAPEVDAVAILGAAHRKFGQDAGARWGEGVEDASDALYAQHNRGGCAVWQQVPKVATPGFARKDFGRCPHVEEWRRLGATDDEIRTLCQDVLSEGDRGNLDPHPGIELDFGAQIGAGADHCEFCLSCPARA